MQQQEASRPAIVVRRPVFELTSEVPRYWYADRPFATHVFDALSSVFPEGEAFFVRSVRHYVGLVEDEALKRAVSAFSAQEGIHSNEHARHVQLLLDQGYSAIGSRNRLMRRVLEWSNRRTPRLSLAATAALEHLTALLARQLMDYPERFGASMDARMAPLWQWHALEEAEHKAVAFEVLRLAAPSYPLRVCIMIETTLGLFVETLDRVVYMLWKDGRLFDLAVWRDGVRFLFGRTGLLRGLGSEYRAWFRRDFHPDDIDDKQRIDEWRRHFA